MVHDVGERYEGQEWPRGLQRALELEVRDPVDGGTGYVYLCSFAGTAPRSSRDYVSYTPATEKVDGSSYLLGFSRKAPIVFDQLTIKKQAGGSGESPIDRMKIRLKATAIGFIDIVKTEDDYTVALVGYIDGPVRVIRRTRNRLVIWWKVPSPSALQDNFFYDTFFEFPISVSLPIDLDDFLSEASLRISVDLKGNPQRRFINNRNTQPVMMDGQSSAEENKLDRRPYSWSVVYGTRSDDTAGWLNRLTIGASTKLRPELYYEDDTKKQDGPEEVPGQVGDVGYFMPDLSGLTRGTHLLTSVLYSFPKYQPGLEQKLLAVRDFPLKVTMTRNLPGPGVAPAQP
jgi:hypothetical protein